MTIHGFEVQSLQAKDLVYAFRMMAGKVDPDAQINGLAYGLTSEALAMSPAEQGEYISILAKVLAEAVHAAAVAQLLLEGRQT